MCTDSSNIGEYDDNILAVSCISNMYGLTLVLRIGFSYWHI